DDAELGDDPTSASRIRVATVPPAETRDSSPRLMALREYRPPSLPEFGRTTRRLNSVPAPILDEERGVFVINEHEEERYLPPPMHLRALIVDVDGETRTRLARGLVGAGCDVQFLDCDTPPNAPVASVSRCDIVIADVTRMQVRVALEVSATELDRQPIVALVQNDGHDPTAMLRALGFRRMQLLLKTESPEDDAGRACALTLQWASAAS
ncbi:MAG: hypothetical protein ACHREM_28440, partial [Polyangiales bacterium]